MQNYANSIATEQKTEYFEVFTLGGVVGPEKTILAQFGWKRGMLSATLFCCWLETSSWFRTADYEQLVIPD
jgi:hypothetical protein